MLSSERKDIKIQPGFKGENTMAKMKKALNVTNSRLFIAEEIIGELEDMAADIQNERHREKYIILKMNKILVNFGITLKS